MNGGTGSTRRGVVGGLGVRLGEWREAENCRVFACDFLFIPVFGVHVAPVFVPGLALGMSEQPRDEVPEDDPDGPHSFVYPADPADYAAAKKAYDDEMHARIIARLKKIPHSKRGRWRPVYGS
jgi:hypothetical protein